MENTKLSFIKIVPHYWLKYSNKYLFYCFFSILMKLYLIRCSFHTGCLNNAINGDVEPLSMSFAHFSVEFLNSFLMCWIVLRAHRLFSQVNLDLNSSFTPVRWGTLIRYFSQLSGFLKITCFEVISLPEIPWE